LRKNDPEPWLSSPNIKYLSFSGCWACVRMIAAGIDFELLQLGSAKFVFGKHTLDRLGDQIGGMLFQQFSGCVSLMPPMYPV
jgi:hypothetical protein